MANTSKKEQLWAEAKVRCRLNDQEIKMAKEMGLNPLSLIKNIPNKNERWKAPVADWVRDMYEERQERSKNKKTTRQGSELAEESRLRMKE